MTDWTSTTLGKVLPFKYGKNLPKRIRTHSGEFKVVSSAGFVDTHASALTSGPTVVIGRKGTIGSVYFSAEPVFPIDTTFYVEGTEEVDLKFAYYLLKYLPLREMNNDSAVPGLNRSHAEGLGVNLPPVNEQRAIAATLGALDDKIESNRRAVTCLLKLVRAEFERVIREDSKPVPLGQVTSITKGRSYKSAELQSSDTALVTLKSIDRNGGYKHDGLKPYIGDFKPQQVVHPGELVVAQTDLTQGAEVVGRGVRVPDSSEFKALVASLDLAIVRPRDNMPTEYLYGLLTSESFRQHCRNHVNGTTVLHLAKDAIPTWQAPLVSQAAQEVFAGLARSMLGRMDALNEESDALTVLRDALLPELLSGRIRVAEAQEAVV